MRELIRREIGRANLFAFGIGSSVNRDLIESTARAGGGEPTIVTKSSEAAPAAKRFLNYISAPVLSKISIGAQGITLGDMEPSPCPDVFAARPLVINGTWKGEAKGRIIVRGIGGNGAPFEKIIVHERITSEQDDSTWTDVHAWFWSALRHPLNGPWRAETIISPSSPFCA